MVFKKNSRDAVKVQLSDVELYAPRRYFPDLEYQFGTPNVTSEVAIIVYPDGSEYHGSIDCNLRSGLGINFYADNKVQYEGGWKDDKAHGQGTYIWPDGSAYEGSWRHGKRHGQGILAWSDGSSYDGKWKDDVQFGLGTFTWSDGMQYIGEWKNDKRHGKGTLTWSDGMKYTGEWRDDKRCGQGTLTWSGGRKYEGEWKDDERHGKGTEYFNNGNTRYKGEWRDNKLTGYYLKINASGTTSLHKRNESEQDIAPCTLVFNRNCQVGMWRGNFPVPYNHEQAMEIITSAEKSGPECVQHFCDTVRAYGACYGSTVLSML